MMTGRDLPAIESAASTIITPERSISSHQLDVTAPTSVQDLGDWIADQYGRLDIVVNNAAVTTTTGSAPPTPTSALFKKRSPPTHLDRGESSRPHSQRYETAPTAGS